MYELVQIAENSYYIQSPAKIGLVKLNGTAQTITDIRANGRRSGFVMIIVAALMPVLLTLTFFAFVRFTAFHDEAAAAAEHALMRFETQRRFNAAVEWLSAMNAGETAALFGSAVLNEPSSPSELLLSSDAASCDAGTLTTKLFAACYESSSTTADAEFPPAIADSPAGARGALLRIDVTDDDKNRRRTDAAFYILPTGGVELLWRREYADE